MENSNTQIVERLRVAYKVEELTPELIAEIMLMADTYWQEVAGPFHGFPPDVWWDVYYALQGKGYLHVLVGRDEEKIAGFAFSVVCPHPHYACIVAEIPLLYLHPDYRKGREGIKLVKELERISEEAGAQLIFPHGGMHNGVYRLFEFLKYKDFGRYFIKVLPGGPNGLNPVYKKGVI